MCKTFPLCKTFFTFAPMSEENTVKGKLEALIPQVISIFMTYGIKSVTMDDIARHLRMSKKTLYQFVTDKHDLVEKCMMHDCSLHDTGIRRITSENYNAIDENIEISKFIMQQLKGIHPSIFYDMEKYYPRAWALMQDTREGLAAEVIRANIIKGMSEGYFRPDIHVEIMTRLWIARMNVIFDPKHFPMQEFNIAEVYAQMFTHQIRGLATEKGLKYFEKIQNNPNNTKHP